MKICVPMAPDMIINPEMVDSLKAQTIKDLSIIPVTHKFAVSARDLIWHDKLINICLNCNAALDLLKDEDFGVIQHNDAAHLIPDSLELMRDALTQNKNLVAVSLRKDNNVNAEHITCGCTMFKNDFYRLGIRYYFNTEHCECWWMTNDIRAAGFEYEYVDDKIRINDTHNHLFKKAA